MKIRIVRAAGIISAARWVRRQLTWRSLVRITGAAIWLTGVSVFNWASHKPDAVKFTAWLVLCMIGIELMTWKRRGV